MSADLNKLDREFGETPQGFHDAMQWTLAQCVETPPRRRMLRVSLRGAILVCLLLLLSGAALAVVLPRGGMDWWLGGRWGFVQHYEPEVYQKALENRQMEIDQYVVAGSLVEVCVQEAAWLEDRVYIAISAQCTDDRYEMHPDANMDVDGGLGDEHMAHYLWTEKGFDVPEKVMDDPTKQLLLFSDPKLRVGRMDGMELLGAWDVVRGEDGTIYLMQEFTLDGEGAAWKEAIENAVTIYTDADGYLPLYMPFYTRAFANDAYGDYVDVGVLAFKVKVR